MRNHPPKARAVGFLVAGFALALLLAILRGGPVLARSLAEPQQTPAAGYGVLLPFVAAPAATPTPTDTPTPSPTFTPGPTATPTATPTPRPTFTPGPTPTPSATAGAPDAAQRNAAALYRANFLPALTEDPQWTGDVATCSPGIISPARLAALEKQVNYFRELAGVPPIAFDATMNARAQAAALIMAAEGNLSHDPPSSWRCYSDEGNAGANHADLGLSYGYDIHLTVVRFMEDSGDNNAAVGHREWLLAPPTLHMGAGEAQGPQWDACAVHVVDDDAPYFDQWPATRDDYVAWPPPGYVPQQVAYARWSLFVRDAGFAGARVEMKLDGNPIATQIIFADSGDNGAALANWNGLVWEPTIDLQALDWATVHRVDVAVYDAQQAGAARTFAYQVLLFDPMR